MNSALQFAARVVDEGHGLVYWYGYDEPDQSAWGLCTLGEMTNHRLWCGDLLVVDDRGSGAKGDLGHATTPGTGCGVVPGNDAVNSRHEQGFFVGYAKTARCSLHP